MNIYYITVKLLGDVIIEEVPEDTSLVVEEPVPEPYQKTAINFTITDFTWKSHGQLEFTQAVRLNNIVNRWDEYFYVYVDSRAHNETQELLDFYLYEPVNDTTVNFTVTFKNPYLYGLLNKKTDKLVIYLKTTARQEEMIYNFTENEFGNNKTKKLITLQFDYRSKLPSPDFVF